MRILKKIKRTLTAKVLAAVAAFGLFSPISHASDITDKDGHSLINNDPVHNLYAQELDNNLAVSRYDKFSLSQNEIANLFFNKQGESTYADNLVNFVNERIDINGTVNAVRNGAIDGNLYFLSPEGLAVGKSGVINAGAVNAYSVGYGDYLKLNALDAAGLAARLDDINDGKLARTSESIDINGVVNARNNITLHATEVKVGGTLNQNSNIDFTALVNAGNTVNNISNLRMTADGNDLIIDSGDTGINISVKRESIVDDSEVDVKDSSVLGRFLFDHISTTGATVDLNGTVTASKGITVNANANTEFAEGEFVNILSIANADGLLRKYLNTDAAVAAVYKSTKANINVGKNANVSAGGDINLSATSTSTVKYNSQSESNTYVPDEKAKLHPSFAIDDFTVFNNAKIDLKSGLKSDANINLKADAQSDFHANTAAEADPEKNVADIYAGVGLYWLTNNAEINLSKIDAGGDLSVQAVNNSDFYKEVQATAPDVSKVTTTGALSFNHNDAIIAVNGDINAANVDIKTDNSVANFQRVQNVVEEKQSSNDTKTDESDSELLNNLLEVVKDNAPDDVKENLDEETTFGIGGALNVDVDYNVSRVTVAENAKLTSTGNIDINSELNLPKLNASAVNSFDMDASTSKNYNVSAAVNLGYGSNSADLIVNKNAAFNANDVTLNSKFVIDGDNIKNATTTVKAAWADFVANKKKQDASFKADSDIDGKIKKLDSIDRTAEYIITLGDIHSSVEEKYGSGVSQNFDPSVLVNFYSRAELQDLLSVTPSKSMNVGGSVNLFNLDNDARTVLGEGVNIKADNADITSDNEIKLFSLTGTGGAFLSPNISTKKAAGVSLSIGNVMGKAGTLLGKNVDLDINNTLNVKADNTSVDTGVVYGAGLTIGANAMSGMINFVTGTTNALAVVDDQAKIKADKFALNTVNNSDITAVSGGLNLSLATSSDTSQSAIGIGLNLVEFDVNSIATVLDTAADTSYEDDVLTEEDIARVTAAIEADETIKPEAKEAALEQAIIAERKKRWREDQAAAARYDLWQAYRTFDRNFSQYHSVLGTKSDTDQRGSINVNSLAVDAETGGDVLSIALEGTASTNVAGAMNPLNKIASGKQYFDNITSLTSLNDIKTVVKLGEKAKDEGFPAAAEYVKGNSGNIYNATKKAGLNASGKSEEESKKDGDANPSFPTKSPSSASKTSIAGSLSYVSSDGRTAAILDNININVDNEAGILANDRIFKGSFAGGAAINWIKKGNTSSKTSSVGLGGAAAFTQSNRAVNTILSNVDITGVSDHDLVLSSDKRGTDVAVGVALQGTVSDASSTDVAASVSFDFTNNDIHALTNNANVSNFKKVTLDSKMNDLQIAGGISASFVKADGNSSGGGNTGGGDIPIDEDAAPPAGELPADKDAAPPADSDTDDGGDNSKKDDGKNSSTNIGASIIFSFVDNDIRAASFDSDINSSDTISLQTQNAATQINAGVATAIDASSDASDKNFAGAATYGNYDNHTAISVGNSTLTSGNINLVSDEVKNDNDQRTRLTEMGFDLDGSSYGGEKMDALRSDKDKKILVGGALSVAISKAEGVNAGAALTIIDADNKNVVAVNDSTLNADKAVIKATDNTQIVNVAAGCAGSSDALGGAGSVGWDDLEVDSQVNFKNTTFDVADLDVDSKNQAQVINVAGEVAISGSSTIGLALALNSVDNAASINAVDSTFKRTGGKADLTANNDCDLYAVGAGINISTKGGVYNGNVAINMGHNDTTATADNVTVDNLKTFSISTVDKSDKATAAGAIDVSLGMSDSTSANIGASIAYTEIGGGSSDKEKLTSTIKNSTLNIANDGAINITADDESDVKTIAAGIGVSAGKSVVGAQGGAAVALVDKDVDAVAENNSITGAGDLNIDADSKTDITTIGGVVSAANQAYVNAAVAVAVNKINQDTDAKLTGGTGTQKIDNGSVNAKSKAKILSVSGSGALTLSSSAILTAAGSGSYNYIGSNTNAAVDNATVTAAKNFGVVAQSDDAISNYAGAISGSSGTVGLGVGLSINSIDGDTSAKVTGSTINAAGSDSERIAVKHSISDDAIIDAAISKDSWTATGLQKARKTENLSGLVVDASATHALSSDIASASVNLGNVAVAGSLNFNFINGKTAAQLSSSNVNTSENAGNVSVIAADYTNKGAFTGGAAGAKNFAAGLSSGWSTVTRETNALLDGGNNTKTVNAKDLALKSIGRQGVSDWMLSAAVAVDAELAMATGDNISRNFNSSTTKTELKNANVNYSGNADVRSDHASNVISLNTSGALAVATNPESGIAGALNAGVAVSMDESTVQTTVEDAKLLSTSTSSTADIRADNKALINDDLYSIGAAIAPASAGLAADVAVNNLESTVQTAVNNSEISAKNINVKTNDNVSIETSGGSGAFGTLAGVGANVAVSTSNNSVGTEIKGSSILTASDALTVDTAETRTLKGTTTAVGASLAAGMAVNVNVINVNSTLDHIADSETNKLVKGHLEDANRDDSSELDNYMYAMTDDEKANLAAAKAASKATIGKPSAGVSTVIENSTLNAGGAINIAGSEMNDGTVTNGAVGIGAAAASVADSVIEVCHDTKTNVINSNVTGKSVSVNAQQTQSGDGLKSKLFEAGAGFGAIGVGYNSLTASGDTSINLAGSNITASNGNINVKALDNSDLDLMNVSASAAVLSVPLTFGKTNNNSNVFVSTDGTGDFKTGSLTANGKTVTLRAERATDIKNEVYQVGSGGASVAVTTNDANDKGDASVLLKRSDTTYNAKTINVEAVNTPKVKTRTPAITTALVGLSHATSNAGVSGAARIDVDDGNTFTARTVNMTASSGKSNVTEADAYLMSVNAGAINIDPAPNTAKATSEMTTSITVGDEKYSENATLKVTATSEVDRKAYADTYTIGLGAASGRDRGQTSSKDKVSATIGSKAETDADHNKLAAVNVTATNAPDSNLKGLGAAGGILNIASQSFAENNSENTAATAINGTWNISGDLKMSATVDESVRESARQGSGEIAGGSGVYVDNTIKGTTTSTIDKSATINAANVEISAKNNIDTSGYDGDKYALEDYFGGGIVIDGLKSTLTYDRDAGVKVNGTVTTSGEQKYTARTDGTLRNKVTATGGSIGGGTIAYSTNTVDYDNTIEMDGTLNAGGALNAEANDGITLDTAALTEVGGGAEVLVGKAQNTITRTNRIETGGTVKASEAITLNAGGTKEDLLTDNIQTKIETQVDTKNYSVIPISANDATAKINSNSQIEISKTGNMESGVDVNLTANGGALTTYTTQEKWAWIDGGKTKSNQRLDSTGDNLLGTDNNYVKVDGTLKAGTANPDVNITIAGQAIPSGYTTTQNITPFTITKSRDDIEVTTGTVDYANELSNRLDAINALIGDYTMGNLSNEALSGYVMERERILNKLEELGLLEYATESDGTVVPVPIMGSMFVVSTEIGNIEGTGGNVIINAGSLKGTGTIEAKGAPDVTIENTSNTWLRLHDIDLTGEGGMVKFNGYSVSGVDESVPASLTVKNAAVNGDGNITVSNDPDRTRIALTGTGNYIPVGDVEILGAIDTPNGNVKISNTNGDIDIYSTGGVNGRNVTITTSGTLSQGYTAGIVNIAGDPSYLLTTASDQMQNTAGRALDKRTASKKTTTNADATMNTGNNGRIAGKNIYLAADYINVNGLIQAGYDSYIAEVNDADVNSNSVKAAASAALSGRSARTTKGYTGYFVKNDGDVGKYYVYRRSDAEDESTLEDGPLSDLAEMTQAMTDAYVKRLNSSSNYNVGANVGAVYNADKGYYDWYVPITLTSSRRLKMADIDTGGGTVYLSGRLLSTGNGRIWAANGLADIDIRNNTSLPLDVGQVLNADRSGRIVLADTGRDVWTEYTAGQTRTLTNYTAALQKNPLNYLNGAVTTKNTLGNGTTTSYTPADFTYNWTRGTTTKSRYSYEATQSEWTTGIILDALSGVGLVMRLTGMKGNPQPTEEQARVLASYENTQQVTPQQLNDMGLTAGTYISEGTASDGLNLTTENIITDQPSRGGYTVKTDRDNYLVVEKVTVTANWYKDVGSLQAYTFSVPANKPITIGLMKGGTGNVSFSSGGDLSFTSDVDMATGAGTFSATSTGGSLRQNENAYVTAGQAVLSAYKDINGFKLRAMDYDFAASEKDYGAGVASAYRGMKLSASSTNGGKLNLTVDANTLPNGHVTPGDVELDRFNTTGKASLTTAGSILSKSGEIGGRTLNLTSNNGGIYLNGFTTDGITASATGDINLTNERINVGRLKTSGTVRLKVNELYSNGEAVEMLDEREKHIHAWIDAGLIAPIEGYEGAYADRVKKAVEKYESDVSEEYEQYEAIDHDEYNKRVTTIESEYAAYKDIDRTKYAATLAETAAEYDEYTLMAVDVQVIMQDYERYLSLVGTIGETYPDFPYLKSEFEGYDNVFDYIRDNAEDLGINAELAAKYYGYSSAEEYLASNDTDGKLLAKYEGYDSAEAYITSNLSDSVLMSKYGSYANMAAYLAADATYQNLVTKRDGLYDEANYPTTLQELMDADEQEIKGELNIGAKALYVNNVKYRNIADVETAN